LRKVDNDGQFRYTPIEKISVATNELTISPIGNPVKENIVLLINTRSERTVKVQVSTANGAIVYTNQMKLQAGDANIIIPVNNVPSGLLYVTVADQDNKQVIRIMKQ